MAKELRTYYGAKQAAYAIIEELQRRNEALRELLSYCRDKGENDDTWPDNIGRAYRDVADRLGEILGGKS